MQRANNGDPHSASGPLATTHNSGPLATNGYAPVFPGNYTNQPVMPSGQPEKAWPTLAELVSALKRRLVLATFLGALVGVATASAVWLAMPSGKHKVRALIHVKPMVGLKGQELTGTGFDDFKKTQERLVRARNVLNMVIQDPRVSRLSLIQTADDPLQYLDESIKVSWEAPDLMAVSLSGDNWQEMKVLVDQVVTSFLDSAKTDELKLGTAQRKQMEQTLRDFDDKIKARRDAIERNQRATGAGSDTLTTIELLKGAQADLTRLLSDIYTEEQAIRTLQIAILKHKQNLAAVDTMPLDADALEEYVRTDPQVMEKQQAVTLAEKKYQASAGNYEPSSPTLLRLQAEIRKAREELTRTLEGMRPQVEKLARAGLKKKVEAQFKADADILDTRNQFLGQLKTLQQTKQGEIKALNTGGAIVKVEDDDLKPLLEQRAKVAQMLTELEVAQRQDTRMQLKEEAVVILNQNLRQKVLVALGAFAGGTLLVMAAIGFLEWRSRRVDSVDQVVNDLGMRVIGTIPAFPSKQALKSGDAAQNQNWRFVLNESVNSARTMLLHTAKHQNMQVLMVTSAMQGEGKTSLASQLATSMATAGLRTLILDCDLRNPSMHKLFDAALTPGCSEVLCQEVDVSDAVQPTSVPNLWLIPAGQCSNRVISALAQGHPLETLFNRLRGQFDFIVVDSCPVLPVADTLLVGQHVDGVVLSILQDISQLPKVQTTAERLTQLNIPLLGTVVNGIKPDVHAYGYNYVKQLPA